MTKQIFYVNLCQEFLFFVLLLLHYDTIIMLFFHFEELELLVLISWIKFCFFIYFHIQFFLINTIRNDIEINASVDKVFEYYANPDNIKETWPQDIVKISGNVSGQKSEDPK
jgi:hypothetical protein